MSARRRKYWGWGYEDEAVSPEELAWFENAWSKHLGIAKFDVTPPPRMEEITLRAPRIPIRRWYDQQRPGLFAKALSAAKQALDPKSILNPGVLIDPK